MKYSVNTRIKKPEKWARYKYNLTTNMGQDGKRLTGCEEHIALSRQIAAEGMVLLENDGILPLKRGSSITLFGIGSLDYVMGGKGSGSVHSTYVRNIYEGFALKGDAVKLFEPITEYYYNYVMQNGKEAEDYQPFAEPELPAELITAAAENSQVAIITLHRFSGEFDDRQAEKGDFYLSDAEENLIKGVTSAFDKTVLVLNVGGFLDFTWRRRFPKLNALLYACPAGMEGGSVIADLLCGDINPSGKLSDTLALDYSDYPSAETFSENDYFVNYFEDIFVGYRYFETLPNAADRVIYPFGHGLSYTEFLISKPVAEITDEEIFVTVTVKNVGSIAGKEVVQIYYAPPMGVLGKSKINLAAFKKTPLLAPNEEITLRLGFRIDSMASYDDLGKLVKSAYLLEGGEYHFFAGNSCRSLKKADICFRVSEDFLVTKQLTQKCPPNKLGKRLLADGSYEALPDYPIEEPIVEERVNTAACPDEEAKLIRVAEGEITLDQFVKQLTEEELALLVGGSKNKGVANTSGMGGIDRLDVPAVMTADGPAGLRINPSVGLYTTAFPSAIALACTWNTELAYQFGRAGALECKENSIGVWLTPALNIHRAPLCGRNFEYFSEDPLLAGSLAAAEIKGIQSENIAASAKHFACNNKEKNRYYSDSRLSERALREIYLRGFEICVKQAAPRTVMTGYNLINGRRCCECYELLQGILRDEWGFKGMVTSDWYVPCDHARVVRAGNDIRMPYGFPEHIHAALKSGALTRGELETCAKRILEMILALD